jgi:radical SAM family uncharacterized protein/radical SAM-linked protein
LRREGLRRVRAIEELGARLLEVEKPARYLGGEALSLRKADDGLFSIALCFPDLYEIGMSNNAIRLLYEGLNSMPGVRAERVFAPAPDFESLLASAGIPLYTLETGIALSDVDLLGLSLGYELAATSVLTVLKSGGVPLRAALRGEGDPIVIAGGPAATNPHPFASFLDAAYIGEAEAGFYELAQELSSMKRSGASRADILDRLAKVDAIWMPAGEGRPGKSAKRAVFALFPSSPAISRFPLPVVKTVQDHGTVEIMRGCPNGCRFCHAGYFYRPQRAKPYEVIRSEVEGLVSGGGFREITLSSLSSGDYPGIGSVLDKLNAEYGPRRVSFQLPSLKISSFTLPIVRKLAEVRKSGLTFAIETPVSEWQRSINKDVSFEKTVSILEEAKLSGFKQAKFYFMIGLPLPGRGMGEAKAIVEFFECLASRIQLQINVNVGCFVPKPHTPYQWAHQLREEEALEAINFLRSEFRHYRNIKLSYHSPFIAQLEGVISRGDERVGELLIAAFEKGARLDAWEDHFDRELWRSVIAEAGWPVLDECCGERKREAPLPWDDIGIRVSKAFLERELDRSERHEVTSGCTEECTNPCGVCGKELGLVQKSTQGEAVNISDSAESTSAATQKPIGRLLIRYSKQAQASYLQHLSIVEAFDRAILMCGIDAYYSEGFNPMPRLEMTQPIPIAFNSISEIASLLVCSEPDCLLLLDKINLCLPLGLRVEEVRFFTLIEGKKQRTIGSLEWGSVYSVKSSNNIIRDELFNKLLRIVEDRSVADSSIWKDPDDELALFVRIKLPSVKDHGLVKLLEACTDARPVQGTFAITRTMVLADVGTQEPVTFFKAYEVL